MDPKKTALVIIDMQNFFLSPFLGRPKDSNGLKACDALLKHAIPAVRKAGIRIIWLNWGLTEKEVEDMPPATIRAFGFETVAEGSDFETGKKEVAVYSHGANQGAEEIAASSKTELGKDARTYKGLGTEIGEVRLEDGSTIDGGRLLMRDQWNSALYDPLDIAYKEGMKCDPPDVWIHKNRMSGLWGASTLCTEFLETKGIRTLLFSGVNTDQCVGGSLQDAFYQGFRLYLVERWEWNH